MVGVKVLLAFVGRPSHKSHLRRTWNVAHWWNGRLLLLLGIVLVYDGLLLYRHGKSKPQTSALLSFNSSASVPAIAHAVQRGLVWDITPVLCHRWQASMASVGPGNLHASHACYLRTSMTSVC